jgi:hypothetical protein
MNNIGITPDEWNALSAGCTVTLHHVPFDREDDYMTGDRLAVHKLYHGETAEVTVRSVRYYGEAKGFSLEVSGFRMIQGLAYGGESRVRRTA